MHAEIPPPDGSGGDALERMLRGLPVATLPPGWRATILSNLPPPVLPPRFFTGKFGALVAGMWCLTAFFRLATPMPPPPPEGRPVSFPALQHPSLNPEAWTNDPWLAWNRNPDAY